MSNPDQQSMAKLKRLVRYLKRERQRGQVFSSGKMANEVTTFPVSDWAAGVMLLGNHTLKAYACKHKIVATSSAEAELHAAALGASESKGIVPLLKDLGYEVKADLAIDAKAIEHILHRQSIGILKHIDVAYLWMLDEMRFDKLRVRRVRSEENVADLGTKPNKST